MKLRCLRDLKQWFRYKYLDLWAWAKNGSLGYRVPHGEDAGCWREKGFGWGRAIKTDVSFQNKGSCVYCEKPRDLFGSYRKHTGPLHDLAAIMILSSVQFNPSSPSTEPLVTFWPHHFQHGPLVAGMSSSYYPSLSLHLKCKSNHAPTLLKYLQRVSSPSG